MPKMAGDISTLKAALWLRVSTEEQHSGNQRPALEAEALRRGLQVVRTWEFDGSAWKGDYRPERKELVEAAKKHEFDVLLIWALDRLSRQGIEDILGVMRQLTASGITVVSMQESWIEQSGPMRDILLALFGWVAQMESQRRSERIKAGLARRKAEGKLLGRQAGSKDKKRRKRSGYFRRYAE